MEKIFNYKFKFKKKNIYFLIFNGYYEIGIYVLELYCKIYDLEKKFVI